MLQNSGGPPPRDAGSDPPHEQLGRRLYSNSTPNRSRQTTARRAFRSPAAAERLAFDALGEMEGVAVNCAEALEGAAAGGDRAKSRLLWACMLSRAARSALLTVADIFGELRGRP